MKHFLWIKVVMVLSQKKCTGIRLSHLCHLCMRKSAVTWNSVGNYCNLKHVVYVATPPLLLQQGLVELFVLLLPEVDFCQNGIHVLWYVVQELTQRQGVAAHRLDGWAELLYLLPVLLLLPRCLWHDILKVEVVQRMDKIGEIQLWLHLFTKNMNIIKITGSLYACW